VIDLPPPEDTLSPLTGWTRAHWVATADRLLAAVRPHASPGHALIDLPGPPSASGRWSDGLEGFARTFLLAAFRLAGSGPDEDAAMTALADWYAAGLERGTDPGSPERWPTLREKGQAKVECASVAIGLHLTRPWLWDRLDDRVRARVIAWLADVVGTWTPNNNWVWFRNVTQAFLRSVGGPYSAEDMADTVARSETWYVGDGWYSDGDHDQGGNRNFDHYNGWAMHLYPLWYCHILGADAPAGLLDTYRDRLSRYLADAQHLVGANGSPLLQGRSLTYRFAALAPFWTGAIFDASPLPPGRTRRLASGVLRHFLDAGAVGGDGLLSLGWHHPFPAIRQPYSGPGSPYWASKGFAGLLLPADHPVWTEVEQRQVVEEQDVAVALTGPGWVVSGTVADGVVRIANHGGDHAHPDQPDVDDPFYDRFGYSTVCAPDLGEPDHTSPVDSHVALVATDGAASLRRPWTRVAVAGRTGVSRHRPHWRLDQPRRWLTGPVLTTASVLRGAVEVRIVRVEQADTLDAFESVDTAPHPGPWRLRVGGAALASDRPPTIGAGPGGAKPGGAGPGGAGPVGAGPGGAGPVGAGPVGAGPVGAKPGGAVVRRADGMVSAVVSLRGAAEPGVTARHDANPLGRHSACPWVITTESVSSGDVVAVAVLLGRESSVDAAAGIRVTTADDVVTVHWLDGQRDSVALGGP
jgi:hypothetical protein